MVPRVAGRTPEEESFAAMPTLFWLPAFWKLCDRVTVPTVRMIRVVVVSAVWANH